MLSFSCNVSVLNTDKPLPDDDDDDDDALSFADSPAGVEIDFFIGFDSDIGILTIDRLVMII